MLTVAVDVDQMNTTALARAMTELGVTCPTLTFDGQELVAHFPIDSPDEIDVSNGIRHVTETLAHYGHYVHAATWQADGFPV